VLRNQARLREQEIAVAGLREIRHQDERRRLRNIEEYVDKLTAHLHAEEAERIRKEIEPVAEKRKALLTQAFALDQTYVRALGDLDFAQRQLLDVIQAYDEYLATRLLWVRSTSAPSLAELRAIPAQVALLVSPASWLEVVEIAAGRLSRSPAFVLLLVLPGVLLWKRASLRGALRATGQPVGRPATDRLSFTLQALLFSLLLAAPWPLLAATFGWLLRNAPGATDLSEAVSKGLLWVSAPFFYLRAFRVVCDPDGLAASHFSWPEAVRRPLRQQLGRFMGLFLPAAFVVVVLVNHEQVGLGGGLQRLAIAAVAISLAIFFYGLFEPGRGALQSVLARDRTSAPYRLRLLWLALALAVPAGLVGLDVYGYLYTAATLTIALARTVWLVLVLIVAHQLAARWLTVVHRRLAFQAMRQRREAARAAEQAEEGPGPGGDAAPYQPEEPEVDLATLSGETRKLLNSLFEIAAIIGLWLIWWAVVPAFGLLDEVALWYRTATVAGAEQLVPVTLGDACLAVIIGIITVAATRQFPAFLEIVLRQRTAMTAGGLYTATTLSRYLIVATGSVLVFSTIGFNWSQIQWLVAALGVGIGFGLQEIVANFISGLIILFERPIRIGDVVTVGDADGTVTRIRIRATTIRTWDRKELLVPNKEFVTSRLLNWSLSDQVTRLSIAAGVAYGSDVQKAMALMVAAAEENARVIADPTPYAIFNGFGDNALSLELRCYVGSLDDRLITVSELHQAINRKFNEAGIVIAFPQRDLHLNTLQPLRVSIEDIEREKPDLPIRDRSKE
jgi:potassium efflux system protein